MVAPGQPGLFDDPDPPPPAASAARDRFLAGMLAAWVLDGKPTSYQRAQLEKLAHRTLTIAEGVRLAS